MKRRILCFGDSNTYGYDPRSYLGGRYPRERRWTGLLSALPEWEAVELGENGREIPHTPSATAEAVDLLTGREGEGILVLLGTNDLLKDSGSTAEDVAGRMGRFLTALLPALEPAERRRVVLAAPPPMAPGTWVGEERLLVQSARLGACYGELARRLEISFVDAGLWGISLTFDGVHFSPEGHRAFAAGLARSLPELLP